MVRWVANVILGPNMLVYALKSVDEGDVEHVMPEHEWPGFQ